MIFLFLCICYFYPGALTRFIGVSAPLVCMAQAHNADKIVYRKRWYFGLQIPLETELF